MAKELTLDKLTLAAKTLKVLAHPVRMKIVEFLGDGEQNVSSIQKHIRLQQAVTSQHLKLLLVHNLVNKRREKNFIYYRKNTDIIAGIINCVRDCTPGK
ncbi:MAG: winged helix-turn-helix transcriptional regulator [Candidatus Marinimicrobia bacterium]|nr:winged helix-turn-helix transcriptional regulator [Candidatus Neomarinimicrobiota bacterium]